MSLLIPDDSVVTSYGIITGLVTLVDVTTCVEYALIKAGTKPPVPPVPFKPGGPVGPCGPVAPVAPVEPVEPVDPVDPVEPVLPVEPGGQKGSHIICLSQLFFMMFFITWFVMFAHFVNWKKIFINKNFISLMSFKIQIQDTN